jgi:hypothetical protein
MSLYDWPDPRRLDLRASLRTLREDWLVRVSRQRAGIAVRAVVDVSASMAFGGSRPKLHVVADFVEALGMSAFRVGDTVGMLAFEDVARPDLFIPPRLSRGMGTVMAAALRACAHPRDASGRRHAVSQRQSPWLTMNRRSADDGGSTGLEEAAAHLAGQQGLVFLVSDFHWPLRRMDNVLDLFAHASVVPVVVWDSAETEPPDRDALANLRDVESGASRTLWVRPRLRQEWHQAVVRRRLEIDSYFAAHGLRSFYMEGSFDPDALSRYFFEESL